MRFESKIFQIRVSYYSIKGRLVSIAIEGDTSVIF